MSPYLLTKFHCTVKAVSLIQILSQTALQSYLNRHSILNIKGYYNTTQHESHILSLCTHLMMHNLNLMFKTTLNGIIHKS